MMFLDKVQSKINNYYSARCCTVTKELFTRRSKLFLEAIIILLSGGEKNCPAYVVLFPVSVLKDAVNTSTALAISANSIFKKDFSNKRAQANLQ